MADDTSRMDDMHNTDDPTDPMHGDTGMTEDTDEDVSTGV